MSASEPDCQQFAQANCRRTREGALAADNKVVSRRRAVVVGFVVLLIAAWSNVVAIMLGKVADWTPYAWSHFIGLLLLLVVFVGVILALSDRLSTASTSFLEAPPKGGDGNGPTDGQV